MRFKNEIVDLIKERQKQNPDGGPVSIECDMINEKLLSIHDATIDQAMDSERALAESLHTAWDSKLKRW